MSSNTHLDEYIDFQKYWLVFKRRWQSATAIFAAIVGLSVVTAISMDKVYEAEAKLLIKVDRTAKLTGLDNGSGDIEGLTMESDPLITEAQILGSRPIVQKLIEELDLKDDSGELVKYRDFADNLTVKPITGTDLLQINYLNNDPELAAVVVNKIVELYIEDHKINNRSETATAKEFIEQQIPEVAASVKKAEGDLRNFKNQNRIASLQEETTANIDSISQISNKIDDVEAQLENINARYNRLQVQLNMNWQEASAVSALSQSLGVQRVLEQLQEVNLALAQKRNYLSESTPQIIALKEEKADLKNLLDEQIAQTLGREQQDIIKRVNILSLGDLKQEQIAEFANLGLQKEGLEKQLANLQGTYSAYRQRSDNLPALQEQQRELERRVKAAQSTYQTLLAKLQETRIAEQQNIGNVRVVSEADIPDKEVGPKKKLIVGGAGIAGALLGIGTAFLLDIRDKTIKNTEEIKQILPYPMSGFVPDLDKIEKKRQLSLPDSSMSHIPPFAAASIFDPFVRESFHDIQIKLGLLDSETSNKVIVVTSASTGEGKSSVAANLAIAQAQCGKKVLLIDGDLRCPTQHSLWNVPNDVGLNDILEQKTEWHESLHNVMQNLDLIASGTRNQHPISLFNSPFMEMLIMIFSDRYDSVIIDTPPLVGMSDSKILGKLADGLLFITRPGVANYGSVMAAKEILADRNLNVLGVVANGVDFDLETYGSNYYYADTKYLQAGK